MHAQNILTNTHCVDADIVEDMRILAVENNSTADYRPFPSKIFTVLELAEPLVHQLLELETMGVEVFDAHLDTDVLVVAPVICVICDNP